MHLFWRAVLTFMVLLVADGFIETSPLYTRAQSQLTVEVKD